MSPLSSKSSSEQAPDETVTISEVLERQARLENEAAEVLPFDISKCSKSLGPIRQAVYSCLTCNPIDPKGGQHLRAGFCSSCSVSCHTDHQIVELFVRRNFVCDCGTDRCNPGHCLLDSPLSRPSPSSNLDDLHQTSRQNSNKYDQNFDGRFCICERGKNYDPETETEDMYQCLACEDWRHASCLGQHPNPENWDDLICANCVQTNPILKTVLFKHAGAEASGILVCTNTSTSTGTQGSPDGMICYGKLPDDCQLNRVSNSDPTSNQNSGPCSDSNISKVKDIQQAPALYDTKTQSHSINGSIQTSINHSTAGQQVEEPKVSDLHDPKLPTDEVPETGPKFESSEATETGTRKDRSKKRRSSSPEDPTNENECDSAKRPRLESVTTTSSVGPGSTDQDCSAPFKDPSQSILAKIDHQFSNVFLVAGWRDRWCKCQDCRSSLIQIPWLVEEEEDEWEPGEDADSMKSLHELGLEALEKLPRDHLVNGLVAYNKLKEEMLAFLKPFESANQLVTEQDIKRFFLDARSKIQDRSWL